MGIEIYGTRQKEETFAKIAAAWKAADPNSVITIIQKNDRGGKTLEKTLLTHFPSAQTDSRNKTRIITITKSDPTPPIIEEWDQWNHLSLIKETGFYSMPGLFGWNKIDKGSELLIESLPDLYGVGADFGCGYGYISREVLNRNPKVQTLYGLDIDARAVEAAGKNIDDDRFQAIEADCTKRLNLPPLDFIISNPPFHTDKVEDRTLGQRFIQTAHTSLSRKGHLWIVANTHMPYEQTLNDAFGSHERIIQKNGFKILHALKTS